MNAYEELHARAAISIEAPKLISIIAFIFDDNKNEIIKDLKEFIEVLYKEYGNSASAPNLINDKELDYFQTNKFIKDNKDNQIIYGILQKHISFFCIKFIRHKVIDGYDEQGKKTFDWDAIEDSIKNQYHALIKKAVFRTHIRIEKLDPNKPEIDYDLPDTFNSKIGNSAFKLEKDKLLVDLTCSKVSDGGAIIWTPFKPINDFNRILIRDISLVPARLGRLVNRIIDIDLYSVLALQNIESARIQLAKFRADESQLSNYIEHAIDDKDYKKYYSEISKMAKEISRDIAKSRDAYQRSVSYAEIVWRRVFELREQQVLGWTRIGYLLERRLRPCIRICEDALRSQNAVSREIQEATSLLEAGLSLNIQEQDRKFMIGVQLIAFIPIAYYLSYIIEKFILGNWSWIVTSPIILFALCIIFLTKLGNPIKEMLYKLFTKTSSTDHVSAPTPALPPPPASPPPRPGP